MKNDLDAAVLVGTALDAADAVTDILDGFREGAGIETAPLTPVG